MNAIISVEDLYLARDRPIGMPILADVVYYLKRSPGLDGKELLTGSNLATMLETWRLLHAKHLLAETTLSYDDVARTCGFYGNRSPSKFLQRHTGCTAYEYWMGRSNGHKGLTKKPS